MRSLGLSLLLGLLACGGSDEPSTGEVACDRLANTLKECNLVAAGECAEDQVCAVDCAADAECDQLRQASMPSGSFRACLLACSGVGPDDFVCANSRQYVNKSAVCDGLFQCLDGSDEANCGDAGADAGAEQDAG